MNTKPQSTQQGGATGPTQKPANPTSKPVTPSTAPKPAAPKPAAKPVKK